MQDCKSEKHLLQKSISSLGSSVTFIKKIQVLVVISILYLRIHHNTPLIMKNFFYGIEFRHKNKMAVPQPVKSDIFDNLKRHTALRGNTTCKLQSGMTVLPHRSSEETCVCISLARVQIGLSQGTECTQVLARV